LKAADRLGLARWEAQRHVEALATAFSEWKALPEHPWAERKTDAATVL
jgi:hypothetical protein